MGEIGVTLMDPDHYALDVLNDILNSFGGKLFDEIRSREVNACTPYLSVQGPDHVSERRPGLRLHAQAWIEVAVQDAG